MTPIERDALSHEAQETHVAHPAMRSAGCCLPATPLPPKRDEQGARTGPLIAFETLGPAGLERRATTPPSPAKASCRTPIVYRSVRMIAEAAASVPLLLYEGDDEIEEHPLLDLIARPNARSDRRRLPREPGTAILLVAGNAYVEAVAVDGAVRELHALRPDRMKVIPGADGWPEALRVHGRRHARALRRRGRCRACGRILHISLFHPANDHYGMSPIEAAATAIDIHNTASRWNKALLDNSARPSGALVYAAASGNLTAEQFERLKAELETSFQGARNAGRPLLLEGGLDWKPMSLSPQGHGLHRGQERRRARDRAGPRRAADAARHSRRQHLLQLSGGAAHLLAPDGAAARQPHGARRSRPGWRRPGAARSSCAPTSTRSRRCRAEREALWARLDKASFLTVDEKRAAVGLWAGAA